MYGGFYKRTQGDNLTIVNNNFMGSKGVNDFVSFPQSLAANQILLDVIVANNIFHGRTPSDVTGGGSSSGNFQRNVFSNNLTYETGNDELPPSGRSAGNTGLDNLEATNPLFAGVPINNTWSSSHDFTLQAGSPALSAGSDGTDIGISGGAYPMSGTNFSLFTTQVPTIETLNVEPIILPTDNLDIRIKVKAN